MRYTESKERSAELLRLALAHMGRHDAAFNPMTFAVWYEYATGINARLTRALEECLSTEPRLGDATIARLYSDHVSAIDELAMQRASGELERVMSGIADSAARTGDKAGEFGAQLGGLTRALQTGEASVLEPMISRAVAGTADMQTSAQALQHQIIAGRLEIERLQSDLSRARDEALIDPLTRILNRKAFDQRMQAMLDHAPEAGRSHCLVMLDIDRFKTVNDTYGHVMGDRILQVVAEALRDSVIDPAHCVARYGGEEFAILLPQCTLDTALAVAEASRERVMGTKVRDRRSRDVVLVVTISAGVSAMQPGDDAPSLIARADGALYAAKQAGRNRVNCA